MPDTAALAGLGVPQDTDQPSNRQEATQKSRPGDADSDVSHQSKGGNSHAHEIIEGRTGIGWNIRRGRWAHAGLQDRRDPRTNQDETDRRRRPDPQSQGERHSNPSPDVQVTTRSHACLCNRAGLAEAIPPPSASVNPCQELPVPKARPGFLKRISRPPHFKGAVGRGSGLRGRMKSRAMRKARGTCGCRGPEPSRRAARLFAASGRPRFLARLPAGGHAPN
jgi:hypothetical protein